MQFSLIEMWHSMGILAKIVVFILAFMSVTSLTIMIERWWAFFQSKKQSKRHGAIVSFEMKEGYNAAKKVCESTNLFLLAESLGGVESLIDHVVTMTHSSTPKERQREFGLTPGLIRLSVGIEDVEDLIEDLEKALEKI